MRTKGILTRIGGTLWNEAPSGTRKIATTEIDNGYGPYCVDTLKQDANNAAHLADCWNAIEQHCGGEPERVGEIVNLLKCIAAGTQGMNQARALLAKIGG